VVRFRIGGRALVIEGAPGVHPVDAAIEEPLRLLPVRQGDRVLDLGCGTGLYGLAAARLGAGEVVLADVDPRAARCARANARRNGVRARVVVGDFFAPVRGERFDLVVGLLPQTPGPRPFRLDKYGGKDGTDHLRRLFREAPRHLRPGGRIFFLMHTLNDNARLLRLARRRFSVRVLHESRRPFAPAELDALQPGLFDYLVAMRRAGKSRFAGRGRRYWFQRRFAVATLRETTRSARRTGAAAARRAPPPPARARARR
jgi:release factor glutamine methyltransferase